MNERWKCKIQRAFDVSLAGLAEDPWLAGRVLKAAQEPERAEKAHRRSISLPVALALGLLLACATAFATVQITAHEMVLREGVQLMQLLPDQWQGYDVCHRIADGYLAGGFRLDGDTIAPMEDGDAIVCLDEGFAVRWSLRDPCLTGCLFDVVQEGGSGLYLGLERQCGDWRPALMKVSHDGCILWLYEGDAGLRLHDFAVSAGDQVYLAGQRLSPDGPQGVLMALDADGALLWTTAPEELANCRIGAVHAGPQGAAFAGSSGCRVAAGYVDDKGQVVFLRFLDAPSEVRAVRLQRTEDDRLVLSAVCDAEDDATCQVVYFVLNAP